jgi:anti-sigma factor RsiW
MNDDNTIKRVLGPSQEEVLCDECFEKIDEYVELEVRGEAADAAIPGMRPHLEGCPACHEEYESLSALVRAGQK